MKIVSILFAVVASMATIEAFSFHALPRSSVPGRPTLTQGRRVSPSLENSIQLVARRAVSEDDAEEITKKYGLEAGLFSIFKSKEGQAKGMKAKDLLAKYGSAYLLTSISLSIVSFSLCYALISAGVDVGALLTKVGIDPSQQTETAGTAALAYAAHKAASPIRFPPTVALTPFVANAIGKKVEEGLEQQQQQ